MVVEFTAVDNPLCWCETVARQFGVALEEGRRFAIPPHIGQGFFCYYTPFEGLGVTISSMCFAVPMTFRRRAVPQSSWFPIMFYTNEESFDQLVGERQLEVGMHFPDGIFLPSSEIESEWHYTPGVRHDNITLSVNGDWLASQPSAKGCYLLELLHSGRPFYLFESVTSGIHQTLRELRTAHDAQGPFAELEIHALCVRLLFLLLRQVEEQERGSPLAHLNHRDVEAIFGVRATIHANLQRVPTVPSLAQAAGMSPSKLQRCFRQVFGMSLGEYAQGQRMEWAKRLLATGQHSVSEVGYRVGYSNLSHFTAAFRRHTGVNPKRWGRE